MAPTELHSVVPMLAALGSPFYNISSQLSLNLPTQNLGFTPVQSPYEPFSFPFSPLPFLGAMDQGNKAVTFSCMPVSPPEDATQSRAVRNDPALTKSLHAKPHLADKGELIAKVTPLGYHNFFELSRKEAKLMPPHWPYCLTKPLQGFEHRATHSTRNPACTSSFLGLAIPMNIEPNTSDYALKAIISQLPPGGCNLHLNTVYPRGKVAELSHESYVRGPWTILGAFPHWLNYPEGTTHANQLPHGQLR